MFCKAKSAKKTFFFWRFPQGFQIAKHIGHPTSGNGRKKTFKLYLKSEHMDGQTDTRTRRRTFRLIESIGPEGRCFEYSDITMVDKRASATLIVEKGDIAVFVKRANIT